MSFAWNYSLLKKSEGTKESPHRLARENAMTKRMEALTADSAEETIAATTRDFPPNLEPGNTAAYKKQQMTTIMIMAIINTIRLADPLEKRRTCYGQASRTEEE